MINENLNRLLDLAKGQRSQNEFALHCGVSSSALTRIKNGDYNTTPDFLKKVANRAHNGVTYEQLMIAAGFLTDEKSTPPTNIRSDVVIPDVLHQVGIGFHKGEKSLTQDDINDIALIIEMKLNKRNAENEDK